MSDENSKVYVGNLEYSTSDEELRAFFEGQQLQVKAVDIIKDKYTGRAKGFGFVELDSNEAVQKAIQSLDGQELKGRKLKVSEAKKSQSRPPRQ